MSKTAGQPCLQGGESSPALLCAALASGLLVGAQHSHRAGEHPRNRTEKVGGSANVPQANAGALGPEPRYAPHQDLSLPLCGACRVADCGVAQFVQGGIWVVYKHSQSRPQDTVLGAEPGLSARVSCVLPTWVHAVPAVAAAATVGDAESRADEAL